MIRKISRVGAAMALAAALGFSGILAAGPAQASPATSVAATSSHYRGAVKYVALGDSYAAGQGAPPYENECLQSDASYPAVLDEVRRVNLVADPSCSGATTTDVVLNQLPAIEKTRKIGLVTVTVGANDLNTAAVAAACSVSFESVECQAALAAAYALLTPPADGVPSELAVRLTSTFTSVAAAMPRATTLVTGYPYLFETPAPTDPNYATIAQLNAATTALNDTILGVVAQLAESGIDIRYVDVTAAFVGHGIGSADPWINSAGIEAFHPTATGYVAYAAALQAELRRR